ncbi:DUF6571 family protein [Streptomyces sp. N35]|uniref:DUF6571 family protein n=1 Tax=Streptomyces sp. N35 TaxID=2795730 RepID=UPI0018F73FDA|nr:DUF6571 family protein [Streptomyces sp. N35]
MNFDDLRQANFKLLDDAVTDWSTMVRNLKDLEKDANDGLLKDSRKANWKGESATVSREFVGKTAGEFGDAHTQAESIWKILQDTRDELKDFKKKLNDAVDRAGEKKVSVTATGGGGFKAQMNADPEPSDAKAVVDAIVKEIQGILEQATESDGSAAKVLRALADLSEYGFSDAKYKDRDSAADALKEAERLSALARKKPEDLTAKDFDALNAGLKAHAGDPLFSERFAEKLGPKGTLEFWAGINGQGPAYELRDKKDQFDELQKNLSLTLASATQADTPEMRDWTYKMTQLGGQPVGQHGPLGFQVMSNLMRWGDYDDAFLTRYGSELVETEKKLTDNGRHGATMWQQTGIDPLLNHTGTDSGGDPFTGFMKALSNSPDAATDFFNGEFVSKDEDHEFLRDTDDENTYKGKVALTNFQYLFEERDWPLDYDSTGEKSVAGKNALGHALEAATTGHPAGTLPSPDTVAHSTQQAALFQDIVQSVGKDQNRLLDHGYLSDSFGKITAEYMPDINRALTPTIDHKEAIFPANGEVAKLSEGDTTKLLYALGRNPEGYAAVNLGQHNYTSNVLHYHAENPDALLSGDKGLTASIRVGETAGEIQGIIGGGRAFEAEDQAAESDAEYNKALDSASTWGGALAGTGIGLLVAPTAGPGAIVAADAANTAAGEIISSITDGAKKDSTGEVIYQNGKSWDATHASTYKLLEVEVNAAGKASGSPNPAISVEVAAAAERGFTNARTNITDHIDGESRPQELG